jgi:hypothetical protein
MSPAPLSGGVMEKRHQGEIPEAIFFVGRFDTFQETVNFFLAESAFDYIVIILQVDDQRIGEGDVHHSLFSPFSSGIFTSTPFHGDDIVK